MQSVYNTLEGEMKQDSSAGISGNEPAVNSWLKRIFEGLVSRYPQHAGKGCGQGWLSEQIPVFEGERWAPTVGC